MDDRQPIIIKKLALAAIKDNKVLMARSAKNPEVFYSLGGKVEPNESDMDCLHREVMEEAAARIDSASLKYLTTIEDEAFGKDNTIVQIKLYFGELLNEPKASSEIAELAYFDSMVDIKHLSPAGVQILAWLKEHGYIN
jgi:8-oxo-dGTP diphosphatase